MKWGDEIWPRKDDKGRDSIWVGRRTADFPNPSDIDPVNSLKRESNLMNLYLEYDMELHPGEIVRGYR